MYGFGNKSGVLNNLLIFSPHPETKTRFHLKSYDWKNVYLKVIHHHLVEKNHKITVECILTTQSFFVDIRNKLCEETHGNVLLANLWLCKN